MQRTHGRTGLSVCFLLCGVLAVTSVALLRCRVLSAISVLCMTVVGVLPLHPHEKVCDRTSLVYLLHRHVGLSVLGTRFLPWWGRAERGGKGQERGDRRGRRGREGRARRGGSGKGGAGRGGQPGLLRPRLLRPPTRLTSSECLGRSRRRADPYSPRCLAKLAETPCERHRGFRLLGRLSLFRFV